MQLEITATSHNRVDWVIRSKIIWIEIGLILGVTITSLLLAYTGSPVRWRLIAVLVTFAVIIAGVLASTNPVTQRGVLERLPDGGELVVTKFWLPIGPRKALVLPVDEIEVFRYQSDTFQDADSVPYQMGQLWIHEKSGKRHKLTGWLDPNAVMNLGEELAKASRCEYTAELLLTSSENSG